MIPDHILRDNTSGSAAITDQVMVWISEETRKPQSPDNKRLIAELDKLIAVFPHFASLHHLANSVKPFLKANKECGQNMENAFTRFIDNYRVTWKQNQIDAAKNMLRILELNDKTLMLHSHSNSVVTLFRIMAQEGSTPKIIQTVSEPAKEGKIQAEHLAQMGFHVKIINEAAASLFMRETEMLITGADAIFQDYVVNKTGTLSLALLCRHFSKPWFILTDSRKVTGSDLIKFDPEALVADAKPADEIWVNPPDLITPVNYYFESIPRYLAAAIYTEQSNSG